MKKLFNYIFASILVISSVIAIGHFVNPKKSQSISAEVTYQSLTSSDVTTSTLYTLDVNSKQLGTASEEGLVDSDHRNANLPCYAVTGFTESGLAKIKNNPYIILPSLLSVSETLSGYIIALDAIPNNSGVKGLSIPAIYRYVGDDALSSNKTIEEVRFLGYNTLKQIGTSAFYNTSKLKSVTTYKDGQLYKTSSLPVSITTISDGLFEASAITTFNVAKEVTKINSAAFNSCENLTEVVIQSNSLLNYIGDKAFEDCHLLSSINLQDNLHYIGSLAFSDCYSLNKIEIPESVTFIVFDAFYLNVYMPSTGAKDLNLKYDNSRAIIFKGSHEEVSKTYPIVTSIGSTATAPSFGSINNQKYTYVFIESNRAAYYNLFETNFGTLKTNLIQSLNNNVSLYLDIPFLEYDENGKDYEYDVTSGGGSSVKTVYKPLEAITCLHTPVITGLTIKNGDPLDITGYEFAGWYLNGDETMKVENGFLANFGDIQLIAKYNLKSYDVNIVNSSKTDKIVAKHGQTIEEVLKDTVYAHNSLNPAIPNFVGLYTDNSMNNLVGLKDVVTSDLTLYVGSKTIDQVFNLKLDTDSNTYTVYSFKNGMENISKIYIPKQYNGKDITKLAAGLFIGNTNIQSIFFDIDSSVTSIGNRAFQGCTNLRYLEIPAKCDSLPDNALENTTSLSEIVILGSINLGTRNAVPTLSKSPSSSLKIYYADEDSAEYPSNYTKAESILVSVVDNPIGTTSSDPVEKIQTLFKGHYITLTNPELRGFYFIDWMLANNNDITFSSGVYSYADVMSKSWTVSDATFGKKLSIEADMLCKFDYGINGDSCASITGWSNQYAIDFKGDTSVIDLPLYVKYEDNTLLVTEVFDIAFRVVGEDTFKSHTLHVHQYINLISDSAFENTKFLKNVYFDENSRLSVIGANAFDGSGINAFVCNSMYLTDIGSYAFANTSSMKTFSIVSEMIHTISDYTFYNAQALTSFDIPKNVEIVNSYAFANTSMLNSLIIPEDSELRSIGANAFENSGLINISLNICKNLESIGKGAFKNTKQLKSLDLCIEDYVYSLHLYNKIFEGSALTHLRIHSNVIFEESIKATLSGALNVREVVVENNDNVRIFNYIDPITKERDNIVYSLNGDNTYNIEYIPVNYAGNLLLIDEVKQLTEADVVFNYLPKLRNISFEDTREIDGSTNFYVHNNQIFLIDTSTLTAKLLFVSNERSDIRYVLQDKISINIAGFDQPKDFIIKNIETYALNSNVKFKILSFAEDFQPVISGNISALNNIYSNVEVIEITKNIAYMVEGNFINCKNLKTIRILNTVDERGDLYSAKDTTLEKVFDNMPIFLVPESEVKVYGTQTDWDKISVDSKLYVNFVCNGGDSISPVSVDFESIPVLSDPVKVGYDFKGWYTDENLTTPYKSGALYTNITLYADYGIHEYNYTYMVGDKVFHSEKVAYNTLAQGPEKAPKKTGKIFDKWTTKDGIEYDLKASKATSDMVLYATFKTDSKYVTKLIIIAAVVLVVIAVVITLAVKISHKKKAKRDY